MTEPAERRAVGWNGEAGPHSIEADKAILDGLTTTRARYGYRCCRALADLTDRTRPKLSCE